MWTKNAQLGGPPRHQVSFRTSFTPRKDVDVDVWLRYVGESEAKYVYDPDRFCDVDEYLTMDLRLAWRPSKQAEFSIVGQNLLGDHMETVMQYMLVPAEVKPSVYGIATFRF